MAQAKILDFWGDPMTARLRFKLLPALNLAIVVLAFLILAVFFAMSPYAWLFDFGLIAVLFYVYFGILQRRAVGMRCTGCGQYIEGNTPWVCGFKECVNENV